MEIWDQQLEPQNNYLYGSNQNLRLASGSSYYDNGLSNGSLDEPSLEAIPSNRLTHWQRISKMYQEYAIRSVITVEMNLLCKRTCS